MSYSDRLTGFGDSVVNWARSPFNVRVPVIVALALVSIMLVNLLSLPDLLLIPALAIYLVAVVATFYELQGKGRSGWWIILMMAKINIGPLWLGLSLGAVINVLPVFLAISPARRLEAQP
jgi:hypothetical protein